MKRRIIILLVLPLFICACTKTSIPTDDLFNAIKEKRTDQVKTILERNRIDLDPSRKPGAVNKPLAYAAAYGNLEIVKVLKEKGADINGRVAYGDCPIIKAMEHDNIDIAKYLITQGADVNNPNAFGVTPFMGFCAYGDLELVKLALSHGGKINESYLQSAGNAKGKKNWTPLQSSVAYGKLEVVKLLLENGGDPHIKDSYGKNCSDLAKEKGHLEVLSYLNN